MFFCTKLSALVGIIRFAMYNHVLMQSLTSSSLPDEEPELLECAAGLGLDLLACWAFSSCSVCI